MIELTVLLDTMSASTEAWVQTVTHALFAGVVVGAIAGALSWWRN